MDIDSIKSTWKSTGKGQKNKDELLMMTKIKNHPKIKRIRIKFMIEAILLFIFLAVYYKGFDGDTKPLWTNIFLISSATGYIIVRFIGWLVLQNPIKEGNLKTSLKSFLAKLKQVAISILLTAFLFGSAFISFFTSSISFTKEKYAVLAGMILTLLFLIHISIRNWIKRIRAIDATLKEFNGSSSENQVP